MLPEEAKGDFRVRAIQASISGMTEPQREDPVSAGLSCCLPTDHPRSALKVQKWGAIACLILGFAGLGGGALLASLAEADNAGHDWLLLTLACCSSLAGFVFLIVPVKGGGLFLRPYVGARLADLKADPNISEVFYVGLEDPNTFNQLKLTSDDAGYLALDPVNRRIIIEGVLCRYVVNGEDVVGVRTQLAQGGPGTHFVYRIGEECQLGLTIERQSLRAETWRQLTGRVSKPACRKIADTLGVEPTEG